MRWWVWWRLVALAWAVAAPGARAATDPSVAGRFPVGVTRSDVVDAARGRTITTEIWYPAAVAGRDTIVRRGHFPLVVLVHGNCGHRLNSEFLTVHLASHGFVVASPDILGFYQTDCSANGGNAPGTPRVDDPWRDLSLVRATLHDRAGLLGSFARVLRGQRTGLVGHSLGGWWAQQAMLADPRFTSLALLATLPALRAGDVVPAPRRATLVVGGTADVLLPYDPVSLGVFALLPAPSFLVKIVGGTHSGFTDDDAGLAPTALARQQRLTKRYATALFHRYLGGRRGFARYLTAADAQVQGDDVALTPKLRDPKR